MLERERVTVCVNDRIPRANRICESGSGDGRGSTVLSCTITHVLDAPCVLISRRLSLVPDDPLSFDPYCKPHQ